MNDPTVISSLITSGISAFVTILMGSIIAVVVNKKLESIKSELSVKTQQKLEYMKRKQEVYESLIRGFQYQINGRVPENELGEYRKLANETYDLLSLWASEEVVNAADEFIRSIRNKEPQEIIKANYISLLTALRNDLKDDDNNYIRNYEFIS